ncbi:MAG: glycoside hydrolase family 5 [Caulobacter sp.]|nr:glycoside hydrolase family 5 [Caulobacter sp.]
MGSWGPRLLAALAASLMFGGLAQAAFSPIDPFEQTTAMRRGVNILGYDPLWKGGKARFTNRHLALIKQGGFDTVRINMEAFSHMDAKGVIDPRWLKTLDGFVEAGTREGLTVILDEHNFNECGQYPDDCRPLLVAFWRQLGEHYQDAPNTVVFELLNEPNRGLDDDRWNSLLLEALAAVRISNPTRNVIIGPSFWNSIDHLPALRLPEHDRHLIATVHYYTPMEFTHQGAKWNPDTFKLSGVTWGSPADLARLEADFDKAQAWSVANRRPILLGEFGAYDRAAMVDRARYTAAVAHAAEARGWAWAYWQFDSDFVVYDIDKDAWVEPIRKALIP